MSFVALAGALDACALLPAEVRFDLVYLDPPFGVGATMTPRPPSLPGLEARGVARFSANRGFSPRNSPLPGPSAGPPVKIGRAA